jgi:hypothetical protein
LEIFHLQKKSNANFPFFFSFTKITHKISTIKLSNSFQVFFRLSKKNTHCTLTRLKLTAGKPRNYGRASVAKVEKRRRGPGTYIDSHRRHNYLVRAPLILIEENRKACENEN